jgi:FtsH ternary system domain X5
MSRAYRITVDQRLDRVIKASDHVCTELEILDILPADQTAQLLSAELEARGFKRQGSKLVRSDKGIVIEIDPATAEVLVRAEGEESLSLEQKKDAFADADGGRKVADATRKHAEEQLRKSLETQADAEAKKLQQQVSDELEGRLLDLREELNQVVNKVTAESLKRRAAQIGNIKEISEDAKSGSLKIVVEV